MTLFRDTSEHSWKTNKPNAEGGLPLMSLDKVVRDKDGLRDLNSQLKGRLPDLKAPVWALTDTLISYGHRAETSEDLIL